MYQNIHLPERHRRPFLDKLNPLGKSPDRPSLSVCAPVLKPDYGEKSWRMAWLYLGMSWSYYDKYFFPWEWVIIHSIVFVKQRTENRLAMGNIFAYWTDATSSTVLHTRNEYWLVNVKYVWITYKYMNKYISIFYTSYNSRWFYSRKLVDDVLLISWS